MLQAKTTMLPCDLIDKELECAASLQCGCSCDMDYVELVYIEVHDLCVAVVSGGVWNEEFTCQRERRIRCKDATTQPMCMCEELYTKLRERKQTYSKNDTRTHCSTHCPRTQAPINVCTISVFSKCMPAFTPAVRHARSNVNQRVIFTRFSQRRL